MSTTVTLPGAVPNGATYTLKGDVWSGASGVAGYGAGAAMIPTYASTHTGTATWASTTLDTSGGITCTGTANIGGDLNLSGELRLKGKPLSDTIAAMEARLAILHPNPELEERWESLRQAREQYIALEKDLIEKEKIWKILKS